MNLQAGIISKITKNRLKSDDVTFQLANKLYEQKHYSLASIQFNKLCKKGYASSCYNLGLSYDKLEKPKEELESYKKACKLGNADGCSSTGANLYWKGKYDEAISFTTKGCDGDSNIGCALTGLIYLRTEPEDGESKALPYLKKACDLNYGSACYYVGEIEINSKPYYEKGCDLNDPEACYELGNSYSIKNQDKIALKIWRKACELGNADACYDASLEVEDDQELLEKACKLGQKEACATIKKN